MMLMRQRTQLSNAIRGHMAEFGLVAPIGRKGLQSLIKLVETSDDACAGRSPRLPSDARHQLQLVNSQILESDRRIIAQARVQRKSGAA